MYGATVKSHTYMDRVANHSTKGSRRGFVDVATGIDPSDLLTLAQRRDNLKRRHAALYAKREKAKNSRAGKDLYAALGKEMFAVQQELSEVNAQMSKPLSGAGFDYHFAACARAMLVPSEYERIAEAARRRAIETDRETP